MVALHHHFLTESHFPVPFGVIYVSDGNIT